MAERKETRQGNWQKKQREAGRCWRCSKPAAEKFNSRGKVIGHYALCPDHREIDRKRKIIKYHDVKKAAGIGTRTYTPRAA